MNRLIGMFILVAMVGQVNAGARLPKLGAVVPLERWVRSGAVTSHGDTATLGAGRAKLSQSFEAHPLHIIYFGVTAEDLTPTTRLRVAMQCLDDKGKVVLTEEAVTDGSKSQDKPGLYFKTHAFTQRVHAIIEKLDDGPAIRLHGLELRDEDADRKIRKPQINLSDYLLPIWNSTSIRNETVLLLPGEDGNLRGSLLFAPTRIIAAQDYRLKKTYREGMDYRLEGRQVVASASSSLPRVNLSKFQQGNLKWFDLNGKHLSVTYEHSSNWDGPIPGPSAHALSVSQARLKSKKPFTIAALGDSITLGVGTSGFSQIPPYMPAWPDLVAEGLKRMYSTKAVKMFNVAVGGMTSDWGARNATSQVASLKPDLVLVAFGMNDFWWMPSETFRDNVQKIIGDVRAVNPKAEFILIAPMQFDSAYTTETQYPERMKSYAPVLRSLQSDRVQVVDLTAMTDYLYQAKSPHDFVADPLHPNDFLARIYAQCVLAMFMDAPKTESRFAREGSLGGRRGDGA